jgi:hypothetical protein
VTTLSRRSFLAAGAGAVLLAACGSEADGNAQAPGTTKAAGGAATSLPSGNGAGSTAAAGPATTPPPGGYQVIQFFPDGTQAAGTRQRFPFGLGDSQGVVEGDGGPKAMVATLVDAKGAAVVDGLLLARHDEQLKRPYWPLITDSLPTGIYDVTLTADGVALPSASISVSPPEAIAVVKPGDTMPALATPTTKNAAGVDPICTADPACPLHGVTLAEALKGPHPVAFLVGTPAYCSTGICGPVLDVLLDARKAYDGKITFLHAEVYTDTTLKTTTAAVNDLGLSFEPSLFLVRDGVVRDRIDVIFDRTELDQALAALVA